RISVLDVFYCPKNFETVANLILKCAIAIFIIQQLMLSVNSNYDFGAIEQALYNIIGQSDEAAHTLGFADGKSILALHVSPSRRKH
ncbi:hypothetical protein, partial [Lentilactobacillus kefiri]|uniref:hypothetical protein n=1 Tax=Lentilactobacillus kefiri TaxID=33962 RepID=UPI0025A1A07E